MQKHPKGKDIQRSKVIRTADFPSVIMQDRRQLNGTFKVLKEKQSAQSSIFIEDTPQNRGKIKMLKKKELKEFVTRSVPQNIFLLYYIIILH